MTIDMGRNGTLSRIGVIVAFVCVPVVIGASVHLSTGSAGVIDPRPDIVLILTDDQRADTLQYMPTVRRRLVERGVTFTNAYVVDPLCCPSRASILTGLYSHTTGVYSNDPDDPNGGFPAFDDRWTVATWLDHAGYRTGLFGKYLNGYATDYVPPGWDRWFGTQKSAAYYDYRVTSDGEAVEYGHDPSDYGTTVLANEAGSFIRETAAQTPVFAYISVPAPHQPSIPAPGDETAFGNLEPWRPPSYDERVVADKPPYIRSHRRLDGDRRRDLDATRLDQLRSLLAVDRLVGTVLDALEDTGRLANTMIAFTSDNGVLWGEHRWDHKDVPYEESVGVPFVVRYDAVIPRARIDPRLVLNVDLAPTWAAAAGIEPIATEGADLLPLLADPGVRWRRGFLIEHMGSRREGVPSYCAYHTSRYVLIRYSGYESELYDLRADPWQMRSLDERGAGYARVRSSLNARLVAACVPAPPALALHA